MTATVPPPTAPPPVPPQERPKVGIGRILGGLALSLLSAVMLYVMWAGHGNLWPLVFVAFVPMYVAAYRLLPRKLSGIAFGIAGFGYWFSMAKEAGGVLAPLVVIGIATFMGLVWFGLGVFERRFSERTNYKWFVVQLALLWVGIEIIFQNNLIMGSMYWIAYRTATVPAFVQPVSIMSTPALSFLIIMVNATVALLLLKWMDGRWPALSDFKIPAKTVKWSSILTLGLVIVWITSSLVIYSKVNGELGPAVKVATVQTGADKMSSGQLGILGEGSDQGSPEDIARNAALQTQLTDMTLDAARQGAQLVVWPEEELDYDVRVGDKGAWVGALAKQAKVTIVGGYMPQSPDLTSPNLVAVWFPNGQLQGQIYAKVHPVLAEGEAFDPGTLTPIYQTSFGNLGVIICFDSEFPESSPRISALAGANILAVPSLDPYSIVHLRWQSLTFRAIENRIPIVKTDIGFDSAIINANGDLVKRVATEDPAGSTNLLVADVNIGPRGAPFSMNGGYGLALLVELGLVMRYVRHIYLVRKGRRASAETPVTASVE